MSCLIVFENPYKITMNIYVKMAFTLWRRQSRLSETKSKKTTDIT